MWLVAGQVVVLSLLSLAVLLAVPTAWISFSPDATVLGFYSHTRSFLPLAAIVGALVALLAYILGWNPRQAVFRRLRSDWIVPVLTRPVGLFVVGALLLVPCVVQIAILSSASRRLDPTFTSRLWSEDFAGAAKALGQSAAASPLRLVYDAFEQDALRVSQGHDKSKCRDLIQQLDDTRKAFRLIETRYLLAHARASCLRVLEDPVAMLESISLAEKLAWWLGDDEVRRTRRRAAQHHFYGRFDSMGFESRDQQLRHIVRLVATDPDETALRLLGASYFQLGEYANAASTFDRALDNTPSADAIERKKLLNNLALTRIRQHQLLLASTHVEEGLDLPYDRTVERERKEQIRLLATLKELREAQGRCADALAAFDQRQELKQQEASPCTSLLRADVLACGAIDELGEIRRTELLSALLTGVSQDPSSFVDDRGAAVEALVEQAGLEFGKCYTGLQFPAEEIRTALRGPMHSDHTLDVEPDVRSPTVPAEASSP